MSISKKHLADLPLRQNVINLYINSLLTMEQVSHHFGIGHHTVCTMLKEDLDPETLRQLKSVKYSASKQGKKNPMTGKIPPNYKGECEDGRGYLTRVVRGKRQFVHRIVFAEEVLGIMVEELPPTLAIHHIDEDKVNNSASNLAAATNEGHRLIHQRYLYTTEGLKLKGLTLAEAAQYLTSK